MNPPNLTVDKRGRIASARRMSTLSIHHAAQPLRQPAALAHYDNAAPLRVLLIDDHPLFRVGLASILCSGAGSPPIRLCEAATVVAAIDRLQDGDRFDLIVYDWHLPGGGGVRGLVSICQVATAVPVVVISADEDEAIQIAALQVGAAAFISKASDPGAIRDLIHRQLLLGKPEAAVPVEPAQQDHPATVDLTRRQHAVLRLMAQGYGNKDIARRLDIAENTVRSHVSEILRAFGAANRTQAVVKAGRLGFVHSGADAIVEAAASR